MLMQNRRLSLAYKGLSTLLCGWGLVLATGLHKGTFDSSQLLYYTNQSNILCLVYFILSAVFVWKTIQKDGGYGPATFLPRVKGAVVMAITVTMLIYWVLLHDYGFSMDAGASAGPSTLTNLLVHLVTPLLMVFDWLLFDTKGVFRPMDPLAWVVIPLLYYGFSLAWALTGYRFHNGSRYPYFFIDSDVLGPGGVAVYVLGLVAVFLVIGYLVLLADRLMGGRGKRLFS